MAEVGSAFVSLLPSARGFGRKMQSEVGGEVKGASKKLGATFGKVFAVAGGLAIGGFIKDAITGAGDLEQSIGAIDTVFGKSAKKMHEWSEGAALDVGLTKNEFNELGTLIGSQLKNGGTAMDELAPKTNNLIELGADLSSMFGGTTKEAVESLSSALKGERDPIEKYGVSLNQAKIDAEAAALGFEKVDGALSDEAKQAATLSLIMKQTSDAHGNFAKESNTYAGKVQRLGAQWGNLKTTLGNAVLPMFTNVVGFLNDSVMPAVKNVADNVGPAFSDFKDALGNIKDRLNFGSELREIAETSWGKLKGGVEALKGLKDLDLSDIDGAKLGSQISDALNSALTKIGAGNLTAKIGDLFGKIDWAQVGLLVGREIPAMFLTLTAGMLSGEAMDRIGKAMQEHWRVILVGALSIAFMPAKLLAPLTKILGRIPFVGAFLAGSVKWLNQLGGRLTKMGGSAFQMFWRGFSRSPIPGASWVARMVGSLKSLPTRMRSFLKTLETRLGVWALDAFEAIGRASRTAIGAVLKWLAGVPGMIFRAIGSLARTLSPRGSEAMSGLLRGLMSALRPVTGFLATIRTRAVSAVGNLGSVLTGAGQRLIDGLVAGIRSRISAVTSAMSSLASKIRGFLPGSPIKEGPLKSWNNGGAGQRLMDTLVDGIVRRRNKVATAITGVLAGLERTANPLIRQAESLGDKIADALGTKGIGKGLKKRLKGLGAQVGAMGKDLAAQLQKGLDLRDAFTGIRDSVASAFRSDWFSAAAQEAELDDAGNIIKPATSAVENFLQSLSGDKGIAESVTAAFAKLKAMPGLSKEFLSQLFQSGNADLITSLANGPAATVQNANALFGQVNTLTDELGKSVGANQFGEGIYAVRDEIRELRNDLRQVGPDVGKAINTAAAAGQRAKKLAAKKKAGKK